LIKKNLHVTNLKSIQHALPLPNAITIFKHFSNTKNLKLSSKRLSRLNSGKLLSLLIKVSGLKFLIYKIFNRKTLRFFFVNNFSWSDTKPNKVKFFLPATPMLLSWLTEVSAVSLFEITDALTPRRSLKLTSKPQSNQISKSYLNFFSELSVLNTYYSNYLLFLHTSLLTRLNQSLETKVVYDLLFKFSRHKFFISLSDPIRKRNYFSLTTGLLLKYFEDRKKSIKKTLPLKLTLVRFLRKLLLLSGLSLFNFWIRGVPLFLPQLFNFLNKPLPTPIVDPFNHKIINELEHTYTNFTFNSLIFWKSKSFGFQKTKKKGRIKRKIRRKIVSEARVLDEA